MWWCCRIVSMSIQRSLPNRVFIEFRALTLIPTSSCVVLIWHFHLYSASNLVMLFQLNIHLLFQECRYIFKKEFLLQVRLSILEQRFFWKIEQNRLVKHTFIYTGQKSLSLFKYLPLREQILHSLPLKGRVEPRWRLITTNGNSTQTNFIRAIGSIAKTSPTKH